MTEALALSVVIPCRNAARFLPVQLEALAREHGDEPWEVVISDNGSTDDTREVASRFSGRLPLRVVDSSERQGRAFACNIGARAARARALAFVDADDEVAPGYVAGMTRALARDDFVAARIDSETLNPGWVRATRGPFQTDELLNVFDFLPFALGCSLGVTRRAFEAVGGFREDVPFAEDVDFCWRLQLSGTPLVLVPDVVLRYRYQDTLCGLYRQSFGYGIGQAALYASYRSRGMPPRLRKRGVWGLFKGAVWEVYALLWHVPHLRTRADLALFLHLAGYQVGRVRGSFRYRTLYL